MSGGSNSAVWKRAEQLRRWEESAVAREPGEPRYPKKIHFAPGCVFLAACAAEDKEEVLRLLKSGLADIDTANVDGLTALHQACIDDNLDMVEFLVAHGADVNRGDNEGWTPLHATASCGFVSIAKFLIEHGADVAAVNNDGELPLDIAESSKMEDCMQEVIDAKGINCDEARNREEHVLTADIKAWLTAATSANEKDSVTDGDEDFVDPLRPHEKTGANALHVAAAKGYIKVLDMLLQHRSRLNFDVDTQDFDGWTPLHAAAHWGQKEAAEMLAVAGADFEMKNYVGQTPLDVADQTIVDDLRALKERQEQMHKDRPPPTNKRNNILLDKDNNELVNSLELIEISTKDNSSDESSDLSESLTDDSDDKKLWSGSGGDSKGSSENEAIVEEKKEETWKRPAPLVIDRRDVKSSNNLADKSDIHLRRTHSFEADEKFYRRYLELQARIANSNPSLTTTSPLTATTTTATTATSNVAKLPTRSASLRERHLTRRDSREENRISNSSVVNTASTTSVYSQSTATAPRITASLPSSPTSVPSAHPPMAIRSGGDTMVKVQVTSISPQTPTAAGKLSPGNIFKNFFKSFVPPVRDEESETQRKAHAKRVRETRRSTQGVTLEDFKCAQELTSSLVKKRTNGTQQNAPANAVDAQPPVVTNNTTSAVQATITSSNDSGHERRPSWRLKVDNNSKFLLEDARAASTNETQHEGLTVTLPLPPKTAVNDNGTGSGLDTSAASPAAIQRRRKPKRRSTGVVHVDMDEIDPERQETKEHINNIEVRGKTHLT